MKAIRPCSQLNYQYDTGEGEYDLFNILVADDDKNTRTLLKAVLETENYNVYTARNGIEALSVLDKNHIDLIVLDVMMPEMDGYELTEQLR